MRAVPDLIWNTKDALGSGSRVTREDSGGKQKEEGIIIIQIILIIITQYTLFWVRY